MRAALCLLASTALAHAADPVVGGAPVPAGTWPDAVAVIGATGTCSGTLIAPDIVLTAGHCSEIQPERIVAATTDYDQGGVAVVVAATIAHPSWMTSYDVALLVLATPVPDIAPRAIGTACTFAEFTAGSRVDLVGFGLTDDAATGDNTLLNEAMVQVTDPTCADGDGCRPSIAPGGEFVAGGDGVDTCNGDSGGPVYLATPRGEVVIGVVSRGVSGASSPCGGGGIYVRTDKIAPWLADVAGTVTTDSCIAPASAVASDDANPDVIGGCSIADGDPAAIVAMLALLGVRRRRPGFGHARPSPGQSAR